MDDMTNLEMEFEAFNEDTIEDKIESLEVEINQMTRMVEENIRLIAEGDDIEGRTYLKKHLEKEIKKKQRLIAKLETQLQAEEEVM